MSNSSWEKWYGFLNCNYINWKKDIFKRKIQRKDKKDDHKLESKLRQWWFLAKVPERSLCHIQSKEYTDTRFGEAEMGFRDIHRNLRKRSVRDIKEGEFQLKKGQQHQILWRRHQKMSEIGHWVKQLGY